MGDFAARSDRCGGMTGPDMEGPPALGAEGQCIAVGAIAAVLIADGRAADNLAGGWIAVPRAAIEHAVSAAIGWLDATDGNPDAEDDDPAEANGDELDQSYPEAAGPRAQAISGRVSLFEDAEDCDPTEDDDPGGCEHDGREHEDAL